MPLFEAGSRRRVLGAAGKAFLEDCHTILANVEGGVRRARETGRQERIKLRIAFTEIASGDAMLASFVGRVRQALTSAEVDMLPMSSSQQVEALLKGRIDAGFLCCFPTMDDRIAVRPLMEHTMMAVLQRNHRLARRKKLFLRDLQDERLIFVSRAVRPDLHRYVTEGFREAALPVPALQEVNGSARVASLVSVGMGVGLLMSTVRPQLPEGLVTRPIADLSIRYRLAIAWCPESKNSAVATLAAIARDSPLFSNLQLRGAMPARHQR